MTDYAAALAPDTFAVFLFHGVVRENRHAVRNYTYKHLSRARFAEVLNALRAAGGVPVSLPDVVRATRAGAPLPPRSFVVTFDDGFENNASVAAPVLREMSIPATFYLTTGFLDRNSASWTDEIEEAVENTPTVRLSLPFPTPRAAWSAPAEKRELLDAVRRYVKGDARVDPYAFAAEVRRQLGRWPLVPDPELDQKLSWEQVRALDRDPLFTVGGHGSTHRILAFLKPGDLREEIGSSMLRLRAELGKPVEHYSYPEGLSHCYSDEVIDVLKGHGVVCAPTAENGVNRVGDDLFRLKRIMVA